MSNQNESKVNNIRKPNSLKKVKKIENAYFSGDEQQTQNRLQVTQMEQTQKCKKLRQNDHKLSWILNLKQNQYQWGSNEIEEDFISKGQMLKDFTSLSLQEREALLRKLTIIIARMNKKKEKESTVYQVFLAQLKEKQKQVKQRPQTIQNNKQNQQNPIIQKILKILLGKIFYSFITVIFNAIIIILQQDTKFGEGTRKQIGIYFIAATWVFYSFVICKYQQDNEKQKEQRNLIDREKVQRMQQILKKLSEKFLRQKNEEGGGVGGKQLPSKRQSS